MDVNYSIRRPAMKMHLFCASDGLPEIAGNGACWMLVVIQKPIVRSQFRCTRVLCVSVVFTKYILAFERCE